ncbi:amidase [Pseudomonas sp. SZMC_28357]|uniref:amidase n=1 Tax=Pseudomonas sp. SZMC_28357 TaxID=3074380 RepID=UPI0028729B22|nr:amidase [Pseudomonas sp. SZMC_28357]MDR9754808.1 amidase [Pseudomonas sp. SZMC_28357]
MSRPGFVRRHPFSTVLLLLLALLLGWVWQERVNLQAFPDIIGAYTAKEYCSCRYVMNNDVAYCQGYVKQWVPGSLLDDADGKRVTASGMGRTHSAQWIGERQGCRLSP